MTLVPAYRQNLALIVAPGGTHLLDYRAHCKATKEAHSAADIATARVTHAGRHAGAMSAQQAG